MLTCHRSFRFVTLVVIAALPSLTGALLAQEPGCFGPPGPIGNLDFDGGANNLGGGSLTSDGLTLYYDAWMDNAANKNWIMKVTRENVDQPFVGGERLGPVVNAPGGDYRSAVPRISADGRTLYFSALNRPGGSGSWDIWVATKVDDDPEAPFQEAFPLEDVNSGSREHPGCVSPNGEEFFFVGDTNLRVAFFVEPHDPRKSFVDIEELTELNTSEAVCGPTISPDGRYLLWSDAPDWWFGATPRPGGHGETDLWMAVRSSIDAPFEPPVNLPSPPNSTGREYFPSLWADGNGGLSLIYTDDFQLWVVEVPCGTLGPDPDAPPDTPRFIRADCNGDGAVNISDATCTLSWLFGGAAVPGCIAALDTNGDQRVDIADPVALLSHLFAGAHAPAAPFPDCGRGALGALGALGCAAGCD